MNKITFPPLFLPSQGSVHSFPNLSPPTCSTLAAPRPSWAWLPWRRMWRGSMRLSKRWCVLWRATLWPVRRWSASMATRWVTWRLNQRFSVTVTELRTRSKVLQMKIYPTFASTVFTQSLWCEIFFNSVFSFYWILDSLPILELQKKILIWIPDTLTLWLAEVLSVTCNGC